MHNGIPVLGYIFSYEVHDVVIFIVGAAQWPPGFDVFYRGLLRFDTAPSITVASIEIGLFAVTFQTYCIWIKRMKPGKCFDGGEAPAAVFVN